MLARELGKTVKQLLSECDAYELTEWQAMRSIHPFGPMVEDLRAGLAPAVLVNQNRPRHSDVVSPLTFFAWYEKAPKQETPEQLAARIDADFNRINARAKK